MSVLLDNFPCSMALDFVLTKLFVLWLNCCSKEGRTFFAACPTVDFRRKCEVNRTVRLVQVARRMLLPETFTNFFAVFANKNLRPMSCIEECFHWRFLFAICLFQNCKISCAMNSWCLSCSLPHVQSEWKCICWICLKCKVIFIEMVWAPRFTLKLRQTATQERTIVWDEDDYGFVVLLQRRCALSVIFPHVPLCNMLFVLQSTNDFYWMFSHMLLTTFVYQISIILPQPIILSCKNSRQMSK